MKLFFHHGEKSNDNISTPIIYTYYDCNVLELVDNFGFFIAFFFDKFIC